MIFSRDHLGNNYKSLSEMARAYNLSASILNNRLDRGMSLEDALTTPIKQHGGSDGTECFDHLGNKYSSLKARANAYGKHPNVVRNRLANGFTLEEALTIDTGAAHLFKPVTDHLGNKFPNCKAMCDHYHIKVTTFYGRLYHMSLEQALTTPVKYDTYRKYKQCRDHLGNLYRSKGDLCEHYGISYWTLTARLKRGMPLEEALTKKVRGN